MSVQNSLQLVETSQQHRPARDVPRFHELGHVIREYMLPRLPFQAIMAFSRSGSAWYQLVTTTSLWQLPTAAIEHILPAGISSQQRLLEVLRQQASLVAKLSGRLASDMLPQKLNFSTHGPISKLSWSPQLDLSSPSRWLQVSHLHYGHPGSDSNQHIFHSMTAFPSRPTSLVQTCQVGCKRRTRSVSSGRVLGLSKLDLVLH